MVAKPVGNNHPHVKMLLANKHVLSAWSESNLHWTAAIAMTENGAMNPLAIGTSGEFGVMQVMPGRATDLDRWGYKQYPATAEVLQTVEGGVYFGSANLDYLSKRNPNIDWIIRAYNGGGGWEYSSEKSLAMTADYLKKVKANYNKIRKG